MLQPDNQMVLICAQLRADCVRAGHALGDKLHDGDRWIAAAAIRLGLPLVSHDGVFDGPLASSSSPPPSFELLLTSKQSSP